MRVEQYRRNWLYGSGVGAYRRSGLVIGSKGRYLKLQKRIYYRKVSKDRTVNRDGKKKEHSKNNEVKKNKQRCSGTNKKQRFLIKE